ncbi:MAG: N-acetyl-gamma-glutamyl-phosphate reductase [Candidatus Limnocylindria bacterium]
MTRRVSVSVVGATGYAGGELVRLLASHPNVEIASLHGRERDGRPLADDLPHLAPLGLTVLDGDPEPGVEAAFLALPAGSSASLAVRLAAQGTCVIDVGPDLRLRDPAAYPTWYGFDHPEPAALGEAVYGLTERVRPRLPGARLVANPGCYPTAALLALAPLVAAGAVEGHIVVDAKSGISGAGRTVGTEFLFTELTGGTRAYALGGHRHLTEITQGLCDAGLADASVSFVPHLVPQARGILATCHVGLAETMDGEALQRILLSAYADAPFVHVVDASPSTKLTAGTNHAFLHAASAGPRRGVVVAAIDNLGKGAAGQAIQNMNLALGLPEAAGLEGLAVFP